MLHNAYVIRYVCFFPGFICTFYFTTVDILYCLLTSQICGNFTIVSNKFKKMNVANPAVLQEIVKEHQYILK